VHPEHEIIEIASDNICKKRFIANYKKEIKIGHETINICKHSHSRNISISPTA
jgi:hypothetical protein